MIDGVPEAADLIKMGLARSTPNGSIIHITPEGHALLGQKLREASERNGRLTGDDMRKIASTTKTERRKKKK